MRCQPTTVSGFTTTNALAHFDHQRWGPEPEHAIPKGQPGSRVLALEDGDLLPQGDELQSEVVPGAEEGTELKKTSQEKPGHEPSLRDSGDQKPGSCKFLILRSNGILTTDKSTKCFAAIDLYRCP